MHVSPCACACDARARHVEREAFKIEQVDAALRRDERAHLLHINLIKRVTFCVAR